MKRTYLSLSEEATIKERLIERIQFLPFDECAKASMSNTTMLIADFDEKYERNDSARGSIIVGQRAFIFRYLKKLDRIDYIKPATRI